MNKQAILLICVVSVVTIILRFLPFIIFNSKKEPPKIITYLGNILPFSVMAMLVVYCFKDIKTRFKDVAFRKRREKMRIFTRGCG